MVLLVVGLLAAITIPTFSGANITTQDRSAQEKVRNALTVAESIFSSTRDYSVITSSSLEVADPALFGAAAGAGVQPPAGQIGWNVGGGTDGSWIDVWVLSSTGRCWGISQASRSPAVFGEDTAGCTASFFDWIQIPPPNPPIYWQSGSFPSQ